MRAGTRIRSPRRKFTMFAITLTIGRISAGNSTFLIRFPPEISEPAASDSEEENQFQGRMPQNMKSAYGLTPGTLFGMTVVNTNEYTSSRSNGLTNVQKKPSTDPR